MNIIKHIYRYPVKGFPGEMLHQVHLQRNQGIPCDRKFAFSNGAIPVNDSGAWTPCQAFLRMTIRPELTRFQIVSEAEGICLTSPGFNTFSLDDSKADSNLLNEVLGEKVGIHQANDNRGYWDHKDAAISIINLSTLEEIAKVIGQPIDPLRFRANLYVRSEPWSEFHWLGHHLEIGETCLDIIRPIDRCRTTSVNVDTGKLDLNLPALLVRHFGHMFCGVYACVKTPGKIVLGDDFECANKVPDIQLKEAAQQKTAPQLHDWPRPATIVEIKNEASKIKSFWIEDTLAQIGSLAEYKPGQYIRLHNLTKSGTWRSYTISAIKHNKLRITVKRDRGAGSQAVHLWNIQDKITISGPFGDATLKSTSNAIHFISAGIGITPTVAKLHALAQDQSNKSIQITHVARSRSELALWNDVIELSKKFSHVTLNLHLTANASFEKGCLVGRPDPLMIAKTAKSANADVHICGPAAFVNDMTKALAKAKITDEKIYIDRFNSSDVKTEMRPISKTGPTKVTFTRSGITDYWYPEDGTLLDFAEARGAIIQSHCRAGLCKTCLCKILNGVATRLVGLEGDDEIQTLLCSSIPSQDLTLDM